MTIRSAVGLWRSVEPQRDSQTSEEEQEERSKMGRGRGRESHFAADRQRDQRSRLLGSAQIAAENSASMGRRASLLTMRIHVELFKKFLSESPVLGRRFA